MKLVIVALILMLSVFLAPALAQARLLLIVSVGESIMMGASRAND